MVDDAGRCATCGAEHPMNSLELSFRRPDAVFAMHADHRARAVVESDDLCALEDGRRFVRAVLPLPVAGWEVPYRIGVWVEVDDEAYRRIRELWVAPDQASEPPFAATLANAIPLCPTPTRGLAAELRLTGPTTRPSAHVTDRTHALHEEQQLGIDAHRAAEYTAVYGGGH